MKELSKLTKVTHGWENKDGDGGNDSANRTDRFLSK